MKINHINIQNFLGVRSIDVALNAPIALFAGPNHSGKSSICDAIRFAFIGEPGRVSLKKEYNQLIPSHAKNGKVNINTDEGEWSVTVLNNKTKRGAIPDALPYVLDAQTFAGLQEKEKRKFLSGLMNVQATSAAIEKMVIERDCDLSLYNKVKPMLRSGFDAASDDCKSRATELKGAWQNITGERWGAAKGDIWEPEDNHNSVDIESVNESMSKLNDALHTFNSEKEKAEKDGKIIRLREHYEAQASSLDDFQEQANDMDSDVNELLDKIEKIERSYKTESDGSIDFKCPECDFIHRLKFIDDRLVIADSLPDIPPKVQKQLSDLQVELADLKPRRNVVHKNLSAAIVAVESLKELPQISDKSARSVEDITEESDSIKAELKELMELVEKAKSIDDRIKKSIETHREIIKWIDLAEAFSPSGIPGELLNKTIQPFNSRLSKSCELSGWAEVRIDENMQILVNGRRYELLSESEKWRVDALVADAIAHLSGVGLMILDQMDVLDIPSRSQCMKWLSAISQDYKTIIVMATMKAPIPSKANVYDSHWITDGRIAGKDQIDQAA